MKKINKTKNHLKDKFLIWMFIKISKIKCIKCENEKILR